MPIRLGPRPTFSCSHLRRATLRRANYRSASSVMRRSGLIFSAGQAVAIADAEVIADRLVPLHADVALAARDASMVTLDAAVDVVDGRAEAAGAVAGENGFVAVGAVAARPHAVHPVPDARLHRDRGVVGSQVRVVEKGDADRVAGALVVVVPGKLDGAA